MKTQYLYTTGKTIYISDNELFRSMDQKFVEAFEKHEYESLDDLENGEILFWTRKGDLRGGFNELGKRYTYAGFDN